MNDLYVLTFPNGKQYVGVSRNAFKRLGVHEAFSTSDKENPMYEEWRKNGPPTFQILDSFKDKTAMLLAEMVAIVGLNSLSPNGYNRTPGGNESPMKGKSASSETKALQRAAKIGRKLTEEHKRKIGASGIGRRLSPSAKEKIRTARLGTKASPETREKQRLAAIKRAARERGEEEWEKRTEPLIRFKQKKERKSSKGWKHSEETKKKMSLSRSGRKLSEETKAKMSAAKRKTWAKKTPEERAAQGARHGEKMRGRKPSEETKAKMRTGINAYWAKRKAEST